MTIMTIMTIMMCEQDGTLALYHRSLVSFFRNLNRNGIKDIPRRFFANQGKLTIM